MHDLIYSTLELMMCFQQTQGYSVVIKKVLYNSQEMLILILSLH